MHKTYKAREPRAKLDCLAGGMHPVAGWRMALRALRATT